MPPRRSGRRVIQELLEPRHLLAAPVLSEIPRVSIPATTPVNVPIVADGPTTTRLEYSAAIVDGPADGISFSFRPATNTWIRMDVSSAVNPDLETDDLKGSMTFQLFDDTAPDTVRRMVGLIKAGFFDGLTFHRVIPGFVAQGGDPNGDGTGGPGFSFDDEFHPDSMFTATGALAMANSGKDTNGSQFFITTGAQRALDFNHTIWGQLVRGGKTLNAILAVPTDSQSGRPLSPVKIDRIRVIENLTDRVLTVRADRNSANARITVTASNADGSDSTTFTARGVANTDGQGNTINSPPFLDPVGDKVMPRDGTLRFTLSAQDIDPTTNFRRDLEFAAELVNLEDGTVTTTGNTVTFTPRPGLVGPVEMLVGVKQTNAGARGSTTNPFDIQRIVIGVGDRRITAAGIADLAAPAGAGTPGMVVARFSTSDPASATGSFSARINWGDGAVSDGTIVKNPDGSFNVLGDHRYRRSADDFPLTVTITGSRGARRIVHGSVDVRDAAAVSRTGTLMVQGSSGNDRISIRRLPGGNLRVEVNGRTRNIDVSTTTVRRLQVSGYAGDDLIDVSQASAAARIDAGGGRDTVQGSLRNDLILGGAGNDRLSGLSGDDTLIGGAGGDVLDGGEGLDSSDNDSADTRVSVENLI
ncbi:MAG: peptidylprolyl isomerase [Phycisphaerales bacterium]|nr:peptidylprolyl isomerase [Phycisphaerales bacterium]